MDSILENYLHQIKEIPHRGVAGYFGPESISWQLYREPIILLGGVRALLLQVAHPAVAEGVARHSRFKEDAFGRGIRTFKAMATIYFGDDGQARETAMRLNRIHDSIRGNYPLETPDGRAGKSFVANDPELLLWVLATLTETTMLVFENIPVELPPDWRERFYEESKTAARLLGIPMEIYPPDLQAFRKYFSEMTHEKSLLGTAAVSQEITHALLHHKYSVTSVLSMLAAGWLPGHLCQKLGIPKSEKKRRGFENLLRLMRFIYRFVPSGLRFSPAWHQAHYRIKKSSGEKTGLLESIFGWAGRRRYLPLGIKI